MYFYDFYYACKIIKYLFLASSFFFTFYESFFKKIKLSFFFCFFCFFCFFFHFFLVYKNFFYFNSINSYSFKKIGLLQQTILFLSVFVSCFCFFLSFRKVNNVFFFFLLFYFFFNTIVCAIVITKSILVFFFCYEVLLLLSASLVLSTGINKRSLYTCLYFILWTQFGSFLVFLAVLILFSQFGAHFFSDFFFFEQSPYSFFLISLLLFFGFGIKIPVWPFHFWITKTHVEANTGFSIFLSGILVKIALFGLYKFFIFFSCISVNLFFFIIFMSLLDVSCKIPIQTDYKKIVAFATIYEMNFMLFLLFIYSEDSIVFLSIFIFFHALLSSLFFFFVDCIYKYFNTRIVNSVVSVQEISEFFFIFALLSVLLFVGFPFTVKFYIEVFVFSKFFSYNLFMFAILLIFNTIFNIFFFKHFFKLFFGVNKQKRNWSLPKKDLFVFTSLISLIVFFPFFF